MSQNNIKPVKPKRGDLVVQRKMEIGAYNKIKSFGIITKVICANRENEYANIECFWSDLLDRATCYLNDEVGEFYLVSIK